MVVQGLEWPGMGFFRGGRPSMRDLPLSLTQLQLPEQPYSNLLSNAETPCKGTMGSAQSRETEFKEPEPQDPPSAAQEDEDEPDEW